MKEDGRFKKGQTYRTPKLHWDKEWLNQKYTIEGLSTTEIANITNCNHRVISFWMKKHGIKGRSVSEARKIKKWGQYGIENPMFGKTGDLNGNWKGGITPERQLFYISEEWKKAVKETFIRDNFICVKCGQTHKDKYHPLHIHHVVSFKTSELRTDINNLVILCKDCHNWVHSKKNTNKQYIKTYEQFKIEK
jgi:hypothetical protein